MKKKILNEIKKLQTRLLQFVKLVKLSRKYEENREELSKLTMIFNRNKTEKEEWKFVFEKFEIFENFRRKISWLIYFSIFNRFEQKF